MLKNKIQDEFADLPISSMSKFRLRRKKLGLCVHCQELAATSGRCLAHAIKHREESRVRAGSKDRYVSLTYLLEMETL